MTVIEITSGFPQSAILFHEYNLPIVVNLNRYARRFKYAAYLRGKSRQFLSQPKSWSDMNRLSSNIGKYISFAEFIEGLTVNGIDWDPH